MMYRHDRDEPKRTKRPFPLAKLPAPSYAFNHAIAARNYLEQRGLNAELAGSNGWYPSIDFVEGLPRLVIPCLRRDGKVYWQARDITGASPMRYASPFALRGDAIVFLQRPYGYGVAAYDTLVVCEGPMDALAALGTGQCDAAIALMGNTPGEDVWSHVAQHVKQYKHVYVVQDSDAADVVASTWLPKLARSAQSLSLVLPSPAKDFAELSPEQRIEKLTR